MAVSSPQLFFVITASNTGIYTLSLHDALPICLLFILSTPVFSLAPRSPWQFTIESLAEGAEVDRDIKNSVFADLANFDPRSEEHTSELQSRRDLVCRLLLEKKNAGSGRLSLLN